MTQSVSIAAGVEKDKKILTQRLSRKAQLEQLKLSFQESLKNNPEQWVRIFAALGAGATLYTINQKAGLDGTLPGLFTTAALLSPQPEYLLAAAGIIELAAGIAKIAPGLNPTYYTKPGPDWYKQRCAMIGGQWNGVQAIPSCKMPDGSLQ